MVAEPALATAGALTEVRADDRATLGRHCRLLSPGNKVSLGLVEGLNNKIRVIQRSAYGYGYEACLKLKIVANFLPALPENARLNPH